MTLQEISGAEDAALAALESALIESQGEVTYDVAALMLAADMAADELAAKVDGYGFLVAKLEGEAAVFDGEAKRLAAHATTRKNSAKRLKENLLFVLQSRGDKTVTGKAFSASVTANGGKVPVVLDYDVADLPPNMVRTVIEPDTDAIRAELDLVASLDGHCPFAHYGERGQHLRLK